MASARPSKRRAREGAARFTALLARRPLLAPVSQRNPGSTQKESHHSSGCIPPRTPTELRHRNTMSARMTFLALALSTARGFGVSSLSRPAGARRTSHVAMAADGPVCIVTGGSRGLGKAIALQLGGAGCKVVVNYASSAAAAEAVVEEIKGLGGDGIAVQADMSSLDGIKGLFKATAEAFDEPVEVLINDAGITRDTLAMRMKLSLIHI